MGFAGKGLFSVLASHFGAKKPYSLLIWAYLMAQYIAVLQTGYDLSYIINARKTSPLLSLKLVCFSYYLFQKASLYPGV